MSAPARSRRIPDPYLAIARELGVVALPEEPLARYTTMRVGGPAAVLFLPRTIDQAARLHAAIAGGPLPVRFLGGGSNVIVADEGIRAAVIATHGIDGEPEREGDDRIFVPAGRPVPGLVRWAAREGLAGLEFAEGIPARVGGAIRMNAGAHGRCFADAVAEVLVAGRDGRPERRRPGSGDFGYRDSFVAREGLLVLGAVFRLTPEDPERIQERVRAFRERRRATQPLWERSAGCVFANWPGRPAGALIERLGLKGTAVGGAEVSPVHGNFIVNRGNATARDVLALIELVRERLAAATGLEPRLEVEIWRDEA
ncbi:MAG: UDP-N-acetylmuramate dehydrogenase [Acidobacteria bacterium]|nr:MAG: UDP-N-acetylmuramate dehydrogenase [Acidobacteriota bacterium]